MIKNEYLKSSPISNVSLLCQLRRKRTAVIIILVLFLSIFLLTVPAFADDSIETQSLQDSRPGFMTGLGHGLTSPLRTLGLFDLHYEKRETRTDSYWAGLLVGSLAVISVGLSGLGVGKYIKSDS